MSFPDGVTTCTCTFGPNITGIGTNVSVEASVTVVLPGAKRLVWTATGVSIPVAPERRLQAAAGEALTFDVAHVDQAGFTDGDGNAVTGWHYEFNYIIRGPANLRAPGKIPFVPLVGTSALDLDKLPDGATGSPAPTYEVRVNEATVAAEAAAVSEQNAATSESNAADSATDALAAKDAAEDAESGAEDARDLAERYRDQAAAFGGSNDTQVAGFVNGTGPTSNALKATYVRLDQVAVALDTDGTAYIDTTGVNFEDAVPVLIDNDGTAYIETGD